MSAFSKKIVTLAFVLLLCLHIGLANAEVWDEIHPYHLGVAAVKKDDLFGFVNEQGEVVLPPCLSASWAEESWAYVEEGIADARENVPALQTLAEQGAPDAMFALGCVLSEINYVEYSAYLFMASYLAGYGKAIDALFRAGYADYSSFEGDLETICAYLSEEAQKGREHSGVVLSRLYFEEADDLPSAYQNIMKWYDPDSADDLYLSFCIYDEMLSAKDNTTDDDYKHALMLLENAAQAGSTSALADIADEDCSRSYVTQEALARWTSAYEEYRLLNCNASYVGSLLSEGFTDTIEEKRLLAIPLVSEKDRSAYPNIAYLASEGNADALYALGFMSDNVLEKYQWFKFAARAGSATALREVRSILMDYCFQPQADTEYEQLAQLCEEASAAQSH